MAKWAEIRCTKCEKLENDVFALRTALADAIRRPMGVVPASAEGLISILDLDAAEERRVKGKTT